MIFFMYISNNDIIMDYGLSTKGTPCLIFLKKYIIIIIFLVLHVSFTVKPVKINKFY